MEGKTYTAKQAGEMFGKTAKEITARIKKGGIKGVTVQENDEGFTYILTDQSIQQLGALFGLVPKPVDESKKSISIDGTKFVAEINKQGYKCTIISRALGKSENYLYNCTSRGRIPMEAAEEIKRIFGIDAEKFKTEPVETIHEKQPKKTEMDAETIRGAVYNGMMDALVMALKEDTIYKILIRIISDERFEDTLQKSLFKAINGVRVLSEKEKYQTKR